MINYDEPGSPGWWLRSLETRLIQRRDGENWIRTGNKLEARVPLTVLKAYRQGEPPLPTSSQKWDPVSRELRRMGRMNLTDICVTSVGSKMRPVGFRTATEDDIDGDEQASAIFRANRLDLKMADVFDWMLTYGDSYAMVTPNPRNPQLPYITQEDPFHAITDDDPVTGEPRAALKLVHDETLSQDRAYVFLPGQVYVATRNTGGQYGRQLTDWDWDTAASFVFPAGMEDVIPLRRFQNLQGAGEFEAHLDTLDRINETLFNRIMAMQFQATAMRIIAGLPQEDVEGNPIDYSTIFSNDPGSIVTLGSLEDEDGTPRQLQFWESRAIDFEPFRTAIESDMKSFAVATSTPLHLITPDAAQGSAEGANLQREAGTWKSEDRRRRVEHPLAEVMALAFRFAGRADRSDANDIRVIWAPAERFSLAESASSASQLRGAGIPLETIAETVLQMDPEAINRMNQQLADEALRAPVTAAEASLVNQVTANQEPVNDRTDNATTA